MRAPSALRVVALLALWAGALGAASALAQASGRFQLVRSVSGSQGTEDGGRFLIADPRVAFQAGTDRQVLVLFEWQGPAGHHRCEGRWKDPTGQVVFTSTSELTTASPRFSVYWGLSLPDAVARGTWVLEAVVDGEPAGAHAFQILTEAPAAAAPLRRALPVAELYQRGLASTLTLEVVDAGGARLADTSGFFVSPELVSTSFEGINGAHAVRLVTPEGRRLQTDTVAGWNVADDWTLLLFPGAGADPVSLAPEAPRVGDRGYLLDSQGGSGRVIVESAFIGATPGGEYRLGDMTNPASLGAPVYNEYGEVVAALAGSGVPGAGPTSLFALADAGYAVDPRGSRARAPASGANLPAASRTLAELDAAGVFVRPLARTAHIAQGTLDTEVLKDGNAPMVTEQKVRFSRAEKKCVVSIHWIPYKEKVDTTGHFELYDLGNRRLGATEPARLKMRPGKTFVQYWEIPLDPLPPGLYRVDLLLADDPVWRSYFHLIE